LEYGSNKLIILKLITYASTFVRFVCRRKRNDDEKTIKSTYE